MNGVGEACIDLVGLLCFDDVAGCVHNASTDSDGLLRLNGLLEWCGLVLSLAGSPQCVGGLSICLFGSISSRWGLFCVEADYLIAHRTTPWSPLICNVKLVVTPILL